MVRWTEMFAFFLSEFLSTTKRFAPRRRLGLVALCAFCLSLCFECLQLVLKVGFFEVTDLVMNTVGGGVGGVVAGRIMSLVKERRG